MGYLRGVSRRSSREPSLCRRRCSPPRDLSPSIHLSCGKQSTSSDGRGWGLHGKHWQNKASPFWISSRRSSAVQRWHLSSRVSCALLVTGKCFSFYEMVLFLILFSRLQELMDSRQKGGFVNPRFLACHFCKTALPPPSLWLALHVCLYSHVLI